MKKEEKDEATNEGIVLFENKFGVRMILENGGKINERSKNWREKYWFPVP